MITRFENPRFLRKQTPRFLRGQLKHQKNTIREQPLPKASPVNYTPSAISFPDASAHDSCRSQIPFYVLRLFHMN